MGTKTDDGIAALLRQIVPVLRPEAVYLFGSRSRHDHDADSDFDLLVVVPDDTPGPRMAASETYKLARAARVAAYIIACRRSGFEAAKDQVGTLSYEVFHNGMLIHGQ